LPIHQDPALHSEKAPDISARDVKEETIDPNDKILIALAQDEKEDEEDEEDDPEKTACYDLRFEPIEKPAYEDLADAV
jgi:hypothetical protein